MDSASQIMPDRLQKQKPADEYIRMAREWGQRLRPAE